MDMALNFAPLDSLRATLAELCRERRRHLVLLQCLQDLSSHSSFQVRRYVAILIGVSEGGGEGLSRERRWREKGLSGWRRRGLVERGGGAEWMDGRG